MARNLITLTARLKAVGFSNLLERLRTGPLTQPEEYHFSSVSVAKATQRALYNWLWFFPATKAHTTLRLEGTVLSVIPKSKTEKRGRKRLV